MNTNDLLQSTDQTNTELVNRFSKYAIRNLNPYDQQLFEKFGQGPSIQPSHQCVHEAFEDQVQRHPQNLAAIHFEEKITYAELDLQANHLAAHLQKLGVQSGDHVGLFIERSISMLVGQMAILKIGAAYVPQDARLTPQNQLQHVIKTAQIKVCLTTVKLREKIPLSQPIQVLCIDEFMLDANEIENMSLRPAKPNVQVRGQNTCFVLFTSGTTGLPNGVQVTHANLCNILLTEPGCMGMRPGLKVSQILNIAFDMAAWETLGALSHGATLVIRGSDIEAAIAEADVVIATPSILSRVDAKKCQKVQFVAVAGEPCPRPLADKWSAFSRFYNSCGPTEVTIVNTMQLHHPQKEKLTIGKPTPNNTVYVLDENLKPCAIGEVGEMWAGGDCVSSGYIGNDELNADRYRHDPFLDNGQKMFRTRDLGRWTADGELEHFGRTDDQVKIRGFRVELDSVSNVLESVEGCVQAVTLKLNDRQLVAFVTTANVNTEKAKQTVAEKLPYYCTPSLVIAVDQLPATSRGKIDKRALIIEAVKQQEIREHQNIVLPEPQSLMAKISKNPLLMPYNRLAVTVVLINLIFAFLSAPMAGSQIALAALVNFALGTVIRQHDVINLLFKIATSAPLTWPLKIRWACGKVYHFGGIHVGAFFSAVVWYASYILNQFAERELAVNVLLVVHLVILVSMMILALPKLRARYHNIFEVVGRFGSWSSLYLFWVQTYVLSHGQKADAVFVVQIVLMAVITFCTFLPWLRLQKVKVSIQTPSSHAGHLKFNYGVIPFAGSSTEISRDPLYEWHSFANIPVPNEEGFRLTVSRAGDWTSSLIDDKPQELWVKGVPTAGVGNIETLFKKVVWVATGSGIGPCLPHLLKNEVPSTLVWSTRSPRKTYGDAVVDEILKKQPGAIIWDTDIMGKPDLAKLAFYAYQKSQAEAVICIANKKVTWLVNEALETRGIPAFGAIWDS